MDLGGIILAGGKSQRMGQDKGLMLLNDRPLISYVIDVLSPLVENLIIVSNNKAYLPFGCEIIPDLIPEKGPLGGIYTGLMNSSYATNLVMSCDTPFVSSDLFSYLLSEQKEHEAVIPHIKNVPQPLVAVYDRSCTTKLKDLIERGELKMRYAINQLNVSEVNITEAHDFYHQHLFDNLNTPEDFNAAVRQPGIK